MPKLGLERNKFLDRINECDIAYIEGFKLM